MEQEKIFTNHISDKGLISKLYVNSTTAHAKPTI